MRRIARVDTNQAAMVAALRQIGATVQPLHTVGQGCPDLLVGYRGVNYLFEVKDGAKAPSARKLTLAETDWHTNWQGRVVTVETIEQALQAIGAIA